VRSVVRFSIDTSLNSVNNAENVSALILTVKKMLAQNLIPVILGIIIVPLAWMIYFFVEIVGNTGREKVVGLLKIISVMNVGKKAKRLALCA
jgi:hypothetical protein